MPSRLRWRWIIITATLLLCLYGVVNLPTSLDGLVANWNKNIRLGLDLKGGSHIVLQVQVQDAFKSEADLLIERLKTALRTESIAYGGIDRNEPASIEAADSIQVNVRGVPSDREADFRRVVNNTIGTDWVLAPDSASNYKITLRREAALKLREDTMIQTMNTLDKKVNGLGVAEATVQRRGGSSNDADVLVQLPGVDDPGRVKAILQTSAMLELLEVRDGPFPTRSAAMGQHGGVLPLGTRLVRGDARSGNGTESWWLLSSSPVVTGRDLRDARAQQGEMPGRWETAFVLTQDAARRFERFTQANIGRRLAIVLDGVVLSAPEIQSTIQDQGRIMGAASHEEASDLALNLRAGSLPAGVTVIEERTVGPSLGADSIRKGMTAGIVGLALVIASMLLYYRGAGLNAVLALLLNTIMTVAALSYIDATWTLPGIAGLVLSIGMAVDSNVLIFERIKEEMRAGKAVPSAISAGFDRALITIIDTHVTTVVASAFLFMFGTGPVRGFAVTLVIGLVANVFTAVYVSRTIFDVQTWRKPKLTSLSIGRDLFGQSNINFMSKRWLTLGLSAVAILISVGSLWMKGGPKYGLDFRGGTLIVVRFNPAPPIDDLRNTLAARISGELTVQQTQDAGEFLIGTEIADEVKLEEIRQTVEQTLREKYGSTGELLDLNTASQASLEDRLRNSLTAGGVFLDDDKLRELVTSILTFRDRDKNGIIASVDELSTVSGVDSSVLNVLKQQTGVGSFAIRSAEMVGPKAGEQLRKQALYATLGALGGMLVYIAFRFQWVSGVAAVIATIHDVLITLGLFSLTDREISLNIIAALLTLIGYSMNDKIVVFDRVRENIYSRKLRMPFLELVNMSINQTLSRTILTAGPTLLACLALYFLGGDVLNGIAFALFVGIIVGTYSSIFVASAILVAWQESRDAAKATGSSKTANANS
jgi:preprotein translocase subunit SecD